MIINLTVANFLVYTQSVTSNIRGFSITHSLGISQIVKSKTIILSVQNNLVFSQALHFNQRRNLSILDNFTMTQQFGKVPAQSLSNLLYLFQNLSVLKPNTVKNVLTLSQLISQFKGFGLVNTLSLSQTIHLTRTIRLSVTNTFSYDQGIAGYKPSSGFIFGDYTIGDTQVEIQFVFPGWNLSLPLRNPEFGNIEHFAFNRIFRKTRAGTTKIFRESTWPTSRSFSYTIAGLCPGKSKKLLDFLRITIGRTVRLIDYEDREWDVFIMTPAAEVSEQFAKNFAVTLEFQGVPAP